MESKFETFTDEQLVRMAQDGDAAAEEYLIRKYKDVVSSRAQLYFIIGADSEDVVQEGMIGLFKAIKSYDGGNDATFHTFAEVCINRQILTAIKTASRKKHSPLNTSVSLNNPLSDEDPDSTIAEGLSSDSNSDPEAVLVLKEVMEQILNDEGSIFSKFEMQVWNEYLQGKSYKKIAADIGKTPKAVDNAMQRTKKKIFDHLR